MYAYFDHSFPQDSTQDKETQQIAALCADYIDGISHGIPKQDHTAKTLSSLLYLIETGALNRGADMAELACQFVAASGKGREYVMGIAIWQVRPDLAPLIASLSQQVFLQLKRSILQTPRREAPLH